MPTHGHGQWLYRHQLRRSSSWWQSIEYRKGTYYAEIGIFAAGAVNMRYRHTMDAPLFVVEGGEDNYMRGVRAASPELAGGTPLLRFGVRADRRPVAAR